MKRGHEYYKFQTDPETIKTAKVQVWSATGGMLTAQCSKKDAQDAIRAGNAFAICGQAIGKYED